MTRGKSKRARDRYRITYLLGVHVPQSTHYKHAEGKKKKSNKPPSAFHSPSARSLELMQLPS